MTTIKELKVLWLIPLMSLAGCARQADDAPTTAPDSARVLEVLRVTHRSMRELADVIPTAIHEDYDLLTASMANEVGECVKMLDKKL